MVQHDESNQNKKHFLGRRKGKSADRARERITNTQGENDPSAFDRLMDALTDPDPQIRYRAVRAAGRMREAGAVPVLLELVEDPVLQIAQLAVQALGVIGDPLAIPALMSLTDHPELGLFAQAALRQLGVEADEPPLRALAPDPTPYLRHSNGNSPYSNGNSHHSPAAIPRPNNKGQAMPPRDDNELEQLIWALQSDDAVERARAAKALGKRGDWRATEPLIQALQDARRRGDDRDPLDQLGDSAVEPLIASLQDADASVRVLAVMALAKIGDGRAAEPLVQALKDSDEVVQMTVWTALVDMGKPAVEPLIQALRENNPDVQRNAALALGQLEDSAALEALIEALMDIEHPARSAAAKALGLIRDRQAVEPLTIALRDKDVTVRRRAATALGQIGDPMAIEALTWAISDYDHIVRHSAVLALHQILLLQTEQALGRLIQDLRQSNVKVRASAIVALGSLGDKRAIQSLVEALSDVGTEPYLQSLIIESLRKLRQQGEGG